MSSFKDRIKMFESNKKGNTNTSSYSSQANINKNIMTDDNLVS